MVVKINQTMFTFLSHVCLYTGNKFLRRKGNHLLFLTAEASCGPATVAASMHTDTYSSPAAVVVQVHEGPCVSLRPLLSVDEGFGELDAVVDILTAATPAKLSAVVAGLSTLMRVTVARP